MWSGEPAQTPTGCLKSVPRSWIFEDWITIPKNLVIRALRKYPISNAPDGTDDDAVWDVNSDKCASSDNDDDSDTSWNRCRSKGLSLCRYRLVLHLSTVFLFRGVKFGHRPLVVLGQAKMSWTEVFLRSHLSVWVCMYVFCVRIHMYMYGSDVGMLWRK